MKTATAFTYSDEFQKFDYGPGHPYRISRMRLAYDLIRAYGLLSLPQVRCVEPLMAGDEDLLMFHEKSYIEALKTANEGTGPPDANIYGLGSGDNPIFGGLLDWSRLVTGGSLQAASMVDSGDVDIAFHMAGGMHHAMPSRASGFCYINDAVIAITSLLRKGRRVAYIDIDAHHADGVQYAFYTTDKVLTISIHETGKFLFPGTGFETETGEGEGEGYNVNIPLPPFSDDEMFLYAFYEVIPPLIESFRPDVVFAQLGVDHLRSDPLTHLNLTNNGYCEAVREIKRISPRLVAFGGGGYDVTGVARAWTLAWAALNGVDVPDDIPEEFLQRYPEFPTSTLRDVPYLEKAVSKRRMREEVERVVEYLKEHLLEGVVRSAG